MLLGLLVSFAVLACGDRQRQNTVADAQGAKHARELGPDTSKPDRPLEIPRCDSAPSATCFRDTAYGHSLDYDPGWVVESNWIWFGAAGDSVEIVVPHGMYVSTNFGQEHDELKNTASYFRHRLTADGVIELWISADETDSIAYSLSIRRVGSHAPPLLRPTGRYATLTVTSRRKAAQFSIVPISLVNSATDRSKWKAFAQTYKVALVSDSLYELCRVPCSRPDTVKLTPSARVTKRY